MPRKKGRRSSLGECSDYEISLTLAEERKGRKDCGGRSSYHNTVLRRFQPGWQGISMPKLLVRGISTGARIAWFCSFTRWLGAWSHGLWWIWRFSSLAISYATHNRFTWKELYDYHRKSAKNSKQYNHAKSIQIHTVLDIIIHVLSYCYFSFSS